MPDNLVAIVTAEEARERDSLVINAGTPSRTLMQNAGAAAADSIRRNYPELVVQGVEIHAGPGNNGGDGWVVAEQLAKSGVPVRVVEAEPARTPDAIDAKSSALRAKINTLATSPAIVVDALLGTGSKGAPGGKIADAVRTIMRERERGVQIVALDIPTGLDATTGASHDGVVASLTLAFGTIKRGQLLSRDLCGRIEVLDIGLGNSGRAGGSDVALASSDWIARRLPPVIANSHKGTRKRLAIIAGDVGMAGAVILAAKGALRSGIGLLHLVVAEGNRDAVHCAVPSAIVSTHQELSDDPIGLLMAADAIVIGPGLKPKTGSRMLDHIDQVRVPVLLDAGALSAFEGDRQRLVNFCTTRTVVLTPHPAEMGRLTGRETKEVLTDQFEIGGELARETGATVLLKGTPTVISDSARRIVSATGTPALATGGSGDLLSGIIGTLLAQTQKGFESAVSGAWVHGRAAEICGASRGVTLEDILFAMPAAWKTPKYCSGDGVLASLPAVQ